MTATATRERPGARRLETRTERVPLPGGGAVTVDHAPRCWRCDHPLAWLAARPWSIRCQWCRRTNSSPPEEP